MAAATITELRSTLGLVVRSVTAYAAAILAMVTLSAPALAETAAEAAVTWGLIGKWQPDCKAPTTAENAAFTYVVRDGKLYQDRMVRDSPESNLIVAATIKVDGSLETTIAFPNQSASRTSVLKKQGEDCLSVWSNRATGTEQYSIKDGKFTTGNGIAPMLTRCRVGGTTS